MKFITRKTDYGFNALCFLAKQRQRVNVLAISKEINAPQAIVRGILQELNRSGFVNSTKGKGGGFKLSKLPEKISVLDLMVIFQKSSLNEECVFNASPCTKTNTCKLRACLCLIRKKVYKELDLITVAMAIQ